MYGNHEVKIVKVYPRLWAVKAFAIGGVGYLCYETGKLIQKLIDRYDLKSGTITFDDEKKEKES